ncbi:phosphatidylinositol 3,4,5-trisphosphate 5-phosphatase 1-like [Mastacembelus armatus]|uniref:Phosphatidylinositol 3,4,5-trisphosphate 5-phosphatase 1-like n=1 Tax=Mastacembelus armatus TaxID=205130 RepID=A0A3Q3LFP6_9TELE|nr:phosphatidylinositol 3,4,5-trisphosphate 5-phosphatase 1-like [Mastacembelus armatus]
MAAAALPVCYHGAISRKECEDLLGKKNKDGAYLIRDSETIQGAMCLCVYKKKVVYTYRLLQTHNGHYTLVTAGGLEEIFFKTLDDLIHHYKKRNQGLAMHLRHSVKRKTALLIQVEKPPDREPQRMQDQSPRMQEQSLSMWEQSSRMQEQSSRMQEQSPRMQEQSPRMREQSPRMWEQSPRIQAQSPRRQALLPDEEEHDYENAPESSEYVEVLPE